MENLNFYFTGPLEGGHYKYPDTYKLDQSFLKKNLVNKLNNPNLIESNYQEIAEHLKPFYQRGRINLKTDVSGIIIPICHGDISDYFHIAVSISGAFREDLEKIWKANGIFEEHPKDENILKLRANLTYNFMKNVFGIPVFKLYEHLPGYRKVPFPKGRENMSLQERIDCVEIAFDSWVKENFEKKL
ncbi:MAG: hypothetical protein WC812_03450 [Candidatus Pacearchaeota archaeon]|jgi:hypothetical protein